MTVSIIAAVAENGAIGKDNDLIWNLPDDLSFFKETTLGHTVIMGRKNFESIPHKYRPLPGRPNTVITRKKDYQADGATVYHSLENAVEACTSENEVFVIGGGEIYKLALEKDLIDKMYITHVHGSFEADAWFPEINKELWHTEIIQEHDKDAKHDYAFTIKVYSRKPKN